MPIRALLFPGSLPGFGPVRSSLACGSPQAFEKLKDQQSPAAYLVASEDLDIMRQFTDTVVDLNRKNNTKGLSRYFLNVASDKVPIIDAHYKSCRQLRRSIKALITNAIDAQKNNSYIIGIQKPLLNELWERSTDVPEPQPSISPSESSDWLIRELRGSCSDEETEELLNREKQLAQKYVGRSREAAFVRAMVLLAAKSESPVLIVGDTGTGKEIVSRQIHEHSDRKGKPFVAVNCGAISRDLLESDLFGHRKGAFTDAKESKTGLWEFARDGTLFLDEIGDLHLEHQVKILRALQEGRIRPVGELKDVKVKARVIAATNQDLFSMVQNGRFREDLYYRLAVFYIPTPPLRNHPEDVPVIAEYLWGKIAKHKNIELPVEILTALQSHPWPGNVRQLKTILKRLNDVFDASRLTARHLQAVLDFDRSTPSMEEPPAMENDIILHKAQCLKHLKRVYEVVSAIHLMLQDTFLNSGMKARHPGQECAGLQFRLQNLEMMCTRPLLFYSRKLHEQIVALKGKTGYLLNLLSGSFKMAKDFWISEGRHAFDEGLSGIFMEIETVLKNG